MELLPTFRESSPSSKFLQAQDSTIWWTNTCQWHGGNTTLQLHSSTMLRARLLQLQGAIYSQSWTPSSSRGDDTVTTWSWELQTCAWLKATTLLPCLATSLTQVHQWCLSPVTESHGYSNSLDQWAVCHLSGVKRISDHCWPVTLQSTLYGKTWPYIRWLSA
jgi:hypothetical protein